MRTFAEKPHVTHQANSTKTSPRTWLHFGHSREVNSILHLQRTIGNHAVQRLLKSNGEELHVESATPASTRFGQVFNRPPTHPPAAIAIQAKLQISKPGDKYEQEADRIADQVVQQKMPVEEKNQKVGVQAIATQQAPEGECEINEDLENRLSRNIGGGSSMSNRVRAFVEPRMQYDFSKVQIHTDNKAAQMNKELGARAFTHGRDIYFGAGQYSLQSIDGERLLAHELTHVIQQAKTGQQVVQRSNHTIAGSEPDERPEYRFVQYSIEPPDLYSYAVREHRRRFGRTRLSYGKRLPPYYQANLILQIAGTGTGGYGPEDLAAIWALESNFLLRPRNNQNSNGTVDIGPAQLNGRWTPRVMTQLGIHAAQADAILGTNRRGGQTFDGDPQANLGYAWQFLCTFGHESYNPGARTRRLRAVSTLLRELRPFFRDMTSRR